MIFAEQGMTGLSELVKDMILRRIIKAVGVLQ